MSTRESIRTHSLSADPRIRWCTTLLLPLLLLALGGGEAWGQEGNLTGLVVDARTGQPLANVQVSVDGTHRGTLTNEEGRFLITGLEPGEVTVSLVRMGYGTVTRSVQVGEVGLRFEMEPTAVALDELVVTGTPGAVQRRSVGNAITSIRGDDVTEVAPVRNMTDMLSGRSAGVMVLNASGQAGSGPQITMRGRSSMGLAGEPILYIDGIRVDNSAGTGPGFGASISRLNDIRPEDIERIEVIKGPAASTLYGTEAANGVIQVITKQGRRGDVQFELSIGQGANWFRNADERTYTNFWENPNSGEILSANLVEVQQQRGSPVFRTGHVQQYSLTASGGSEEVRFYASVNVDEDQGIDPDNQARVAGGRARIRFLASDALSADLSLGYTNSRIGLAEEGYSGVLARAQLGNPRDLDGPTQGFFLAPPDPVRRVFNLSQDVNRFNVGLQVDQQTFPWLRQRLALGLDFADETDEQLTPRLGAEDAQFFGDLEAQGRKVKNEREVLTSTVDYGATATFPLSDAFESSTSVGLQFFRTATDFSELEGRGFPAAGVTTIAGAAENFGSDDFVETTTVGVYVQQQFGWDNRLFLTGAVRADDNSAFGQEFDFVTYPKVGASWVISEEGFWKVDPLNSLRLRAAFGASGQPPAPFSALRSFRPVPGHGGQPAVTPQFPGNPELKPERGEELELGFEAGFLQDRVGIDFTYYRQRTKDALVSRDAAPSTGFFPGQQFINVGEIENTGVEFSLTSNLLETENVRWDASFSLATNNNEVIDLGLDDVEFLTTSFGLVRQQPGFPVQALFLKKVLSADLDASGNPVNVLCDGGAGNAPMPCDQAPEVFIGQHTPTYEGAFRSSLHLFDRIRVHALVDFKGGHVQYNDAIWFRCRVTRVCEINHFPERFDPVRVAEFDIFGSGSSAQDVEDSDFAKLREVSVTYDLPDRWAAAFGARAVSVSVAGKNLATWHKDDFTGVDPETFVASQLGFSKTSTLDWMIVHPGTLPQPTHFLFKARVQF